MHIAHDIISRDWVAIFIKTTATHVTSPANITYVSTITLSYIFATIFN